MRRLTSFLGSLLALCAGVAIALAAQAWYVRTQVVDTSAFTQRAVTVVAEPQVRSAFASEISDTLAAKTGVAAGEILPAVDTALASRAFGSALRSGASNFNAALFHHGSGGGSLSINLGGVIGSNVIPSSVLQETNVDLVSSSDQSAFRYTNDAADVLRVVCIALPIFALLAVLLALPMASRPARAIAFAGLGAAAIGAVTLPGLSTLRGKTVDGVQLQSSFGHGVDVRVATAIWNGFCGPMHTIARLSLVGGAAVAVAFMLLSLRPLRGGGRYLRD
jgi:hypothetical protein